MRSNFSRLTTGAALIFTAAAAAGAFLLQHRFRADLSPTTLRDGRIVLTPGEFIFHPSDPRRNGSALNIQDGKLHTAAVIPYPARHPQGTWFLIDVALSHWPPGAPGESPRVRKPGALILHNGICADCPIREFKAYGRIRRTRIELLARRANNPDKEFKHERWNVIYSRTLELPDRPGPFRVELPLPPAAASPGYPRNVFFLACKITVLSVHPGSRFPDRVALAEFTYVDGPDPALRKSAGEHIWK